MRRRRDVLIVAGALVAAALLLPRWLGGPDLDRTALSLTLAGPAAGAALSAGVGAYVSGALAIRGIDVPLAVLLAIAACAGAGALLALITARLDVVGLLASTLLVSIGLAALTHA